MPDWIPVSVAEALFRRRRLSFSSPFWFLPLWPGRELLREVGPSDLRSGVPARWRRPGRQGRTGSIHAFNGGRHPQRRGVERVVGGRVVD
jgi:hypothetical protein